MTAPVTPVAPQPKINWKTVAADAVIVGTAFESVLTVAGQAAAQLHLAAGDVGFIAGLGTAVAAGVSVVRQLLASPLLSLRARARAHFGARSSK